MPRKRKLLKLYFLHQLCWKKLSPRDLHWGRDAIGDDWFQRVSENGIRLHSERDQPILHTESKRYFRLSPKALIKSVIAAFQRPLSANLLKTLILFVFKFQWGYNDSGRTRSTVTRGQELTRSCCSLWWQEQSLYSQGSPWDTCGRSPCCHCHAGGFWQVRCFYRLWLHFLLYAQG